MPVFISYRTINKETARSVFGYLTAKNVKCYIDDLDPKLRGTDDITSVIMKRISECTHIMVVVSEHTRGSWWVPFEIGVASQADRRVTSYRIKHIDLPQFLNKWPILKDRLDLDKFIQKYKDDAFVPLFEKRAFADKLKSIKSADQFHRELKRDIGQY